MNLAAQAVERSTLTKFVVLLILVAGVFSYFNLGRLEDPDFTIKTGVIVTPYPGASAEEVELEVTDRIEKAIQELPELDNLYSLSRAGLSIVKVDIKESYWADRLPQVWDKMRHKLSDIEPSLPVRAMAPDIMDDFSFVYGFVLAVTGDGYSYSELEDYVDYLKKDLSLVDGVARVELWGVQPKVIYLDISEAQVAALGLTTEDVLLTLASQNAVVPAGYVEVPDRRLRVEVTGEFQSPDEIGKLQVRRSLADIGRSFIAQGLEDTRPEQTGPNVTSTSELIRIEDIATVRMGYLEPPITRMRFNGQEALAVSLANVAGGNVVVTGQNVDKRLEELIAELPAGINVTRFAWQSDEVKASIDAFIINLAEAVFIVLVVITLAMGWRMGVVIGSALILTILATFIAMLIMGIELHRVSLGALVVALGMMVDNSIVVADGMAVRLGKGMASKEAAIESANVPAWPLLGATFVAVMAFYPVFASATGAGEYARTLFLVVGLSLLISWVLSVTVTPLQCISMIKPPPGEAGGDPYGGKWFVIFREFLEACLRRRAMTLAVLIGVLAFSIANLGKVRQQFFPDSTRFQFVIDYWAPEGTPIASVSRDLGVIEDKLLQDTRVKNFGTFMGAGGPRFYLPVDPEFNYSSYAQIIINTPSYAEVNPLVAELEPWLNDNVPQALTRVRKYTVGPGDTWQFEARITGPAEADLDILRQLGEDGMTTLRDSPLSRHVRTDMRQRVQKVVLDFKQEESRWTGVSRDNVAQATSRAWDGLPVGIYRDGDKTLPIIARNSEEGRARAASELDVVTVLPTLGVQAIPLSQMVSGIALEWEDPIVARWNRRRQVAVQAAPIAGSTYPALRSDVIEKFESMELPPGYAMEWDGEFKSTMDAQLSLLPGMAPALAVILLVIVALFNSMKPPFIMFLTIPFAVIGIIWVLIGTNTAFGFMALLGAMSLVGMMIKNAIVLLDEVNLNIDSGMGPYEATVQAAVSRLRPVVLAALTTVLGVLPLLQDAFWTSMAMTIMAGLTLGTALTMVVIPLFYVIFYRVPSPAK